MGTSPRQQHQQAECGWLAGWAEPLQQQQQTPASLGKLARQGAERVEAPAPATSLPGEGVAARLGWLVAGRAASLLAPGAAGFVWVGEGACVCGGSCCTTPFPRPFLSFGCGVGIRRGRGGFSKVALAVGGGEGELAGAGAGNLN